MKLQYLLLVSLSILLFNCKTDKLKPFIPKNHLESFQIEKSQFFDLDTLGFKKIIGKHGTQIIYHRDLFDLKETDTIQLELIELYDYNEILYRNIQTLTTDNKLLETSGVLKIVFTSNGKEIKLKKGEKLIVYPPKGKLKDNNIFLSKTDSLGNIKWDITNQDYNLFSIHLGGGIWADKIIKTDSIEYYRRMNIKTSGSETYNSSLAKNKENVDFFILDNINTNWVNIDKLVNINSNLNFELTSTSDEFSGFDIYVVYKDFASFIYYSRFKSELIFNDIPITEETFMIVLCQKNNEIFHDRLLLNNISNNSKISLNLKKISKEKLKNLF